MNQDIVNGYPGKMMEPKPHNTSTTTSFIPISILIRFRTGKICSHCSYLDQDAL